MIRKGIAVAGNIMVDKIKIIDNYPQKGMLVNIVEEKKCVGGCVSNTGVDLCIIDPKLKVKAIAKIGKDEDGAYLKNVLKSKGMDTSSLKEVSELATSYTDVMTLLSSGERTFFTMSGANSKFDILDIDIDNLDVDIFHIGYILLLDRLDEEDEQYGSRMSRLLKLVKEKGIKTSIDVVSKEGEKFEKLVKPALKYSDYVIMNEIESGHTAKIKPRDENGNIIIENIKQICSKFFEFGVSEKVVIHCPEAGFSMDKDGTFTYKPSLKLPENYIKGSVGAGDAFCAGALYGIYNNFTDADMLVFASGAAACNLAHEDSISGMKDKSGIWEVCEKFKRN